MSLTKTLRINPNLHHHLHRRLSSHHHHPIAATSSDDEDHTTTPSNFSPSETTLAKNLYSLIKTHYSKNPTFTPTSTPLNPDLILPSLSLDFSQISPPDSLSPHVITHVIKASASVRNGVPFHQILSFFNWAVVNRNVDFLAPEVYDEFIDVCGKMGRFDIAWYVVKLMKDKGVGIRVRTFLILIQRYVRAGLAAEAVLAFNRMEEFGCEPKLEDFTVVVSILCKKKMAKEAEAFFDSYKDRFQADVVVYTSLVNGWCRAGEIAEAERVFNEMKAVDIKPNVHTYTVVLDGLCRSGQITRANDVFAEMLDVGVRPNAATFNNMMRAHVKAGRTENVLQVYSQMKQLSCKPDVITYNFLIESYCKGEIRDEAIKVVNMMEKNGCAPNAWSFNPIFRCIAKANDVNGAHRLFTRMNEVKCKPNRVTYNILMEMFAESKSADMVLKLKKDMDENEVEADVTTFKILISLFYAMGHWNNAYQYLREMVEEKCLKPPDSVYTKVLELLRKAGQLKKHEELVEKMKRRGFAVRSV